MPAFCGHFLGFVPIACCKAINRRLALSAAKPNRAQHVLLGFVALLLNPTYAYDPALMRMVHLTQCVQHPMGT